MDSFRIVDFDPDNKIQMDVIAKIHTLVLPDSFVVLMGNVFMKKFYYKVLPKLGYLKCFLATHENEYVGMIVTNKKPFSLIRSAIPHYFILISFVIFFSIIIKPIRINVLIDLFKYKPDPLLKQFEDSGLAFEILTIGVLEKYRNLVVGNKIKISHLLLKHTAEYYKKNKYNKITGQILKSNKGALGFYTKYNAKFIQSTVRENGVIMDLDVNNIPT